MEKLKLMLSQQDPKVGDIQGNVDKAAKALAYAKEQGAELVIFSELFLSGYPPEDLVLNPSFIADIEKGVETLVQKTQDGVACLIGVPWLVEDKLYNAALFLEKGRIAQVITKHALPNYSVFDEERVFARGEPSKPIMFRGCALSIFICEDIWQEVKAEPNTDIIIVLNGSPYEIGKMSERLKHCEKQINDNKVPLVYVNQVGGQDELVFDGASFVLSKDKDKVAALPAWQEGNLITRWEKTRAGWICAPLALPEKELPLEEVYQAIMLGLRDYVEKNNFTDVVLGLSGGIDSALVAALACDALGGAHVQCMRLPSRYTSAASQTDAAACAKALGAKLSDIEIEPLIGATEKALAPLFVGAHKDLTEENIQSRLRGLLLMGLSNKFGSLLLSTGNKSEISVGYATLYGDMNGGFNPIKDIYKMKVYALANWRNENFPKFSLGNPGEVIPQSIINKAPSAELRENQKDEDSLPPYESLDDILQKLIDEELPLADIVAAGHSKAIVRHIAKLVRLAEYKRRQSPPGVRVSKRNFGKARRYPITNAYKPETKL
jgi:NAD+ synthase